MTGAARPSAAKCPTGRRPCRAAAGSAIRGFAVLAVFQCSLTFLVPLEQGSGAGGQGSVKKASILSPAPGPGPRPLVVAINMKDDPAINGFAAYLGLRQVAGDFDDALETAIGDLKLV